MDELLERDIMRILRRHRGRRNRVTRGQLVWTLKTMGHRVTDRQVRRAIEQLRQSSYEGALICSSSQLDGYWLCESPEELEAAIAEDLSRISSAQAKITNRRRALERLRAQPLQQGRLI